MKKKLLYTAPEAECFEVQTEALICASGSIDGGIEGFTEDPDPLSVMSDLGLLGGFPRLF